MAWYDDILKATSPQMYDRGQARIDLKKFEADPTYRINPSEYADPATGIAYDTHLKGLRDFRLKEQAAPILEKFTRNGGEIQAEDGLQSLLPGAVISNEDMSNPYVRKGVEDFATERRIISDLTDSFAGTAGPGTLARIAAAGKLDNLSTVQSGFQEKNKIIEEYRTDEETKSAAAEYEKLMAKPDISPFERISGVAGIVKKYPRVTKNFMPDMTSNLNAQRELGQVTPTGPTEQYKLGTGRSQEAGIMQTFQLGPPKVVANTTSTAPVNITLKGGVAQSAFVDPATGKPLVFDKATGSYRVANVEGGATPKPAAFTPESAAKAQMVEQALTYMPLIRAGLILPDGTVDRTNVANMNVRTPFTEGRTISTYVMDAVEAKLRAESGAAVPEPEVKRAAKRFIPAVGDNDDQVKIKLNNLETYLKGTANKINQGRAKDARPVAPAGTKARVNGKVVTSDGKGGWK